MAKCPGGKIKSGGKGKGQGTGGGKGPIRRPEKTMVYGRDKWGTGIWGK